jgi:hypothetical protein
MKRFSVFVLGAMIALAGCSSTPPAPPALSSSDGMSATGTAATGSVDTTSASSTAAAPGGSLKGGSGSFAVTPPPGWSDATAQASGTPDVEFVVAAGTRSDGFLNNAVISAQRGVPHDLTAAAANAAAQLTATGKQVTNLPDRQIGGEPALGFSISNQRQDVLLTQKYYVFVHESSVYYLTLSSTQKGADAAVPEFDALLASWAWIT